MSNNKAINKVILAGAGPGDPELITVKLQKRLAEADVIIVDRLVNPAIIQLFAHPSAEILLAGKKGFSNASLQQEQVTALILQQAKMGKKVLRLKGGDTAFFSNILDELIALKSESIEYEIIPGISAASGISAYTAMPLTARNYAQGVHFISYNPNSTYTKEQWEAIVLTNDTLVCYMASANLINLVHVLLENAADPEKPIAIIEQGTTIFQKIHISTLKQAEADFKTTKFSSPSMVIIGDIIHLHELYNWYNSSDETGSVFPQLEELDA